MPTAIGLRGIILVDEKIGDVRVRRWKEEAVAMISVARKSVGSDVVRLVHRGDLVKSGQGGDPSRME